MIIRFGFSNWKSIKDYQELLLTSSNRVDGDVDLIYPECIKGGLVPSSVIYGANASGKSNILDAFLFFCSGILKSNKLREDGHIPRRPFKLDQESRKLPTRMDCDFIIDEVRYQYGYEVSDTKVEEEWLYAFPSGQRQVWFHRNSSEENEFYFGRMLKGKNKIISELTRSDSLFVSHAAENSHEQLTNVYTFFAKKINFHLKQRIVEAYKLEKEFEDECLRNQVMEFVKFADTGIVDAIIKKEDFEVDSDLINDLQAVFKKNFPDFEEKPDGISKAMEKLGKKVLFSHKAAGDSTEYLSFDSESRGTRHLISLLIPVFKTINAGGILVADEIDTSLHPYLSLSLVKLFNSKKTNPNQAQLIFTTHDTTLLAGSNLRRDQIWFTEKRRAGDTRLFPLTDYKLRPTDNKEKAYMSGNVGGVPVIFDLDLLAQALMGDDCV